MDLHAVMAEFRKLGYVSIGQGPKHPQGNPDLQHEIDEFLAQYSGIARDESFVEFLAYYSAAAVDWPHLELTIEIYGFSPDITFYIAHPDEPLLDEKGFYRFAEIVVEPGPKGEESIGGLYAFDVTGHRNPGIYQKVRVASALEVPIDYAWCSNSFLAWLSRVVQARGRLPLVSYNA